jgi:hypothetical protein
MRTATQAMTSATGSRARAGSALKTHVRTRLHRHTLDLELAVGADPNTDALLRERARELIREATRREIAESLERVMSEAESTPRNRTSRVPVSRRAVRNLRPELETFVERLKAPTFPCPQALAMARLLITDGGGPLYDTGPETERELKKTVIEMIDAADYGPSFAG